MWNDKLHNSSKLVHGKRIKYCLLARGYCMMMWASVLEATTGVQRLCLRNLWMAIPREPLRSHVPVMAKALLINKKNT